MIARIIKKIKFELQFNNTRYYERVSEKILKTYYRRKLRKSVLRLPPLPIDTVQPKFTLATLANKARFYESVAALYSFCCWEQNIHIHYHEDGSLDDGEITTLKRIFPGITIFKRSEQDRISNQALVAKGLIHCAHLRQNFLFAIKLVDMIIQKKTPYLLHIDSDVLFFEKPVEILDIVSAGKLNGCFNQDKMDAYTFDEETLNKYVGKPMLSKFNSGLMLHNFDEQFFGFIDGVMENEMHKITSWHLEQTLLAMYASVNGDFLPLPDKYDLLRQQKKLGRKITSEHYVHHTGHDFHKDFMNIIIPALQLQRKANLL